MQATAERCFLVIGAKHRKLPLNLLAVICRCFWVAIFENQLPLAKNSKTLSMKRSLTKALVEVVIVRMSRGTAHMFPRPATIYLSRGPVRSAAAGLPARARAVCRSVPDAMA